MKNNFAAEYEQEQELRKAFDEAEGRNDDQAQEDIRAAYFKLSDSIEAKGLTYSKIYRYYSEARERGNKYIDLSEVVWDRDVEPLIKSFRELGIEYFTFSSTWSSAVETAWLFTKQGCSLEGLLEINSPHKKILEDEYEKAHGYLFKVN